MKLKVIPLFQVIILAGLGSLIQTWFTKPMLSFSLPIIIPLSVLATGILIILTGGVLFRLAKTTVSPRHPHKASGLVTHGLYQYSRNPMYVGFLIILLAWCLYLGNLVALLMPALFILSMNTLQILPEEKALESLFGDEYEQYRQKVRRWV